MLEGITQTAAQLTSATAQVGTKAAEPGKAFSVIRREQPAEAPAASGPLSGAATANAAALSGPGLVERHMTRIVHDQKKLERAMRHALRGDDFSAQQLLALQLQVHKYTTEVESVSRVVDRLTGAVKQAMQTQI
jgi:hypothetical protein